MGPQLFIRLLRTCFRSTLLFALALVLAATAFAQTTGGTTPQVAVVFSLQSTDLNVIDHKYRVFFNKFEKKSLPITGYDLNAAVQDEVMNTLAQDKRYQWRLATEEDKLDGTKLADEKTRTPEMVANAKSDRVLVVVVLGFGAWISGLAKDFMDVGVQVTMLDRATGRKLWKEKIHEKIPFSGDLEKLQADNQKEMREGINTLIEKACQTMKTKIAETKA